MIGVVTARIGAHGYRVNIRSPQRKYPCCLCRPVATEEILLTFIFVTLPCSRCVASASLRRGVQTEPSNLPVGALVYARVDDVQKHVETKLSCCVVSGIKKDWVTGESQFGSLSGGTTIECSPALARSLLQSDCTVLTALASAIRVEIAIGYNGWVWVLAESDAGTVVVANAILNSEFLDGPGTRSMVEQLMKAM